MRKLLLLLAVAGMSGIRASAAGDIIGCWTSRTDAGEHVYLTRDNQFVYTLTKTNGQREERKGAWSFRKGVGVLHLKFDDRPELKMIVKEAGNESYLVDRNATKSCIMPASRNVNKRHNIFGTVYNRRYN